MLQDLAHGRRLEAQHAVDEDRPVEVGVREAVGLGLAAPCAPCARRGRADRDRRRDGPSRGRRGSASARGCCPGWRAARPPATSRSRAVCARACRLSRRLRSVGAVVAGERRPRSSPLLWSRSAPAAAQRRPARRRRRDRLAAPRCRLVEEVAPLVADGARGCARTAPASPRRRPHWRRSGTRCAGTGH